MTLLAGSGGPPSPAAGFNFYRVEYRLFRRHVVHLAGVLLTLAGRRARQFVAVEKATALAVAKIKSPLIL